jgi:hypothetical protein
VINVLKQTIPSGVAFVFFAIIAINTQIKAETLIPTIPTPKLTYVDTSHGLNQDTINDIHVDTQGFVWIATNEGFNRFDGVKVQQVKGRNFELNANSVYKIFEHSNGMFYLSTLSMGIVSFDRDTNTVESVLAKPYTRNSQWLQYSEDMLEMPNGNMLIALSERVYEYNVSTQESTLLSQKPCRHGKRRPVRVSRHVVVAGSRTVACGKK